MRLKSIPCHCLVIVAGVLAGLPVLAQQSGLAPLELPASARPLPLPATEPMRSSAPTRSDAVIPAAAAGAEEVVVEGRSAVFTRRRLERAEHRFLAVYNDINPIEEFDIHCRLHAQTGTRIPQRVCAPNYEKDLSADKGRAVLYALRGEAFGTDWQVYENEMTQKTGELLDHMQRLAIENPQLFRAMQELYAVMESVDPERSRVEPASDRE